VTPEARPLRAYRQSPSPTPEKGFFIFPSLAKILQNENNKHPFVTFYAHSAQKQTLSTGETALNGENFHPIVGEISPCFFIRPRVL